MAVAGDAAVLLRRRLRPPEVVGAGAGAGRVDLALRRVRVRRFAVPALALLGVWIVLGIVLGAMFAVAWIRKAVMLVVSPLWFMAVYLMLVLLLPVFLWLHRRFDTIVLVLLVGVAGAVDIIRFRYDVEWLGCSNMVVVWGLCHQLGFFYDRIVAARRTADWTLLSAGCSASAGLVGTGLYPGSMVGVPGERSNMAPPTLCIVALVLFQAGVVEILRPRIEPRLTRPRWSAVNDVINRFAMPAVPVPHDRHGAQPGRQLRDRRRDQRGHVEPTLGGGSPGRWRSSDRCCSRCR